MSNTFGRLLRLTTYGESHGAGLGGVIDGCPAGIALDEKDIQRELDARRPGEGGKGGSAGTARNEPDAVRLLSGVFQGKTTGTPIAFHVKNTDQRSGDYSQLEGVLRPGHADIGFHAKYGIRDPRGGGRASGRETVSRVAGGAIAQKILAAHGIFVRAFTPEFGGIHAPLTDVAGAETRAFFAPDNAIVSLWEDRVHAAKNEGDSLGGRVCIQAFGLPPGLGEPVFDKLDARLAYALMGVGAVKGIEIGKGFEAARLTGSEHNDSFLPAPGGCAPENNTISCGMEAATQAFSTPQSSFAGSILPSGAGYSFASNNAGGILGGMSSGAPIEVTVAVKPISSIGKEQRTINLAGNATHIAVAGRHDISAIPRIVPVLKAMTALTIADFILLQRCAKISQ